MDDRRASVGFWVVLALAALLLSLRAGSSTPLLDPDESRFARTSVEMARSGDLVIPHFEGQPRLVKPPLLHWIQTALFRTFGPSERLARLPALLATLVSICLVGWIARRRFGFEGAFWAAAILATMPLVFVVGRLGTLDALLSAHVLAMVALDLAEPDERRNQRGFAIGCLAGLAFLIKGPVGVILALLIMLAGRTASGRDVMPRIRPLLLATAGWCAVVLPWGLAFVRRIGFGDSAGIVRGEVLQRFFVGVDHIEPPWFFLVVAAVGFFPWVGPLLVAIARAIVERNNPESRTAVYSAAGLVVGLFFFSIGKSKLATYILPLAPLAAILITWELGQELKAPRRRTLGHWLLAAGQGAAALGLTLAIGMGLPAEAVVFAPIAAVVFAAGALVGIVGLVQRRPRLGWGAAVCASALCLTGAVLFLLPPIAERRSSFALIQSVPRLNDPGRPLVVVDMKVPSLTYYLDRVPQQVELSGLERRIEKPDGAFYVFDEDDLARAPSAVGRLVSVGQQGKYVVLERPPESERSPETLDAPGTEE
jgi:4-amino-4-deoxy-L-arabinose transferase-like glycosyltransferase